MKRSYFKLLAIAVATLLIAPLAIHAQDEKSKEKDKTEKKDVQTIVITRKGESKDKVTVEINERSPLKGAPITVEKLFLEFFGEL